MSESGARRGLSARGQGILGGWCERVAASIIRQIERGVGDWDKPWTPSERRAPYSLASGKPYRGGNALWLGLLAEERNYSGSAWGTYKAVRERGGQVRKGQKGSKVLFWKFRRRLPAVDGDGNPLFEPDGERKYGEVMLERPMVFLYTVFHADQCDGLPALEPGAPPSVWEGEETVERRLRELGVAVDEGPGDRAAYSLDRDRIRMPARGQFPSAELFYATLLHETAHWTGHPDRLARETLIEGVASGFGSEPYAREELIAEIGSWMCNNRFGVTQRLFPSDRCAAYCASWITALRDDAREIHRAASEAQRLCDYVTGRETVDGPAVVA